LHRTATVNSSYVRKSLGKVSPLKPVIGLISKSKASGILSGDARFRLASHNTKENMISGKCGPSFYQEEINNH